MSQPGYVPDRGDVVWLGLDPRVGHEQSGRRPVLVLSPAWYNKRAGLAMVCPVTNQAKGYAFEVPVPPGLPVTGVVLADHARSVDWRVRNAVFLCTAPQALIDDVVFAINSLIG